jgi:uncharacterized protein YraI
VRARVDGSSPPPGDASHPADAAQGQSPDLSGLTPDQPPDGGAGAGDMAGAAMITVGGTARVTATTLNLRSGPSTMDAIITTMPCGASVAVVGGPNNGWWNVTYMADTGWASGTYLVADAAFDQTLCGGTIDAASIIARAKLGVGYSYYWGHGSWRPDGAEIGACMGDCPNCSHNGAYGADCSGFVGKCWEVPSPSSIETDLHPYSTYNFYNDTTHWSVVQRTAIQPADAMVYNANGSGHIVLFESGADPWGNVWLYESMNCSTGIVHDLRAVDPMFITIRREGL